jgi:hypothetical protein
MSVCGCWPFLLHAVQILYIIFFSLSSAAAAGPRFVTRISNRAGCDRKKEAAAEVAA